MAFTFVSLKQIESFNYILGRNISSFLRNVVVVVVCVYTYTRLGTSSNNGTNWNNANCATIFNLQTQIYIYDLCPKKFAYRIKNEEVGKKCIGREKEQPNEKKETREREREKVARGKEETKQNRKVPKREIILFKLFAEKLIVEMLWTEKTICCKNRDKIKICSFEFGNALLRRNVYIYYSRTAINETDESRI